jgi:pentatricopeptide repeat domain-containing protein 1
MENEGSIRPDEILYNCLIDAAVRFGNVEKAVDVFNKMKNFSVEPSSITYGILIKAYGQANMLRKAFETFEEMKGR